MFEKLKKMREEKKLDYEDMAKIIGLSAGSAYWKKETGNIKFSLEQAKAVSLYFQKPIEEIFFENEVSKMET